MRRRSDGETGARILPDADFESVRRSVTRRGGRLAAWFVVIAGPLVTVLALVWLRPVPPTGPVAVGQVQRDPRGWAEMYVRAWLSASRDNTAGVEAFYPPGLASQRAVGTQVPVAVSTLAVNAPGAGVWSVVVAVDLLTQQPEGKHVAKLICVQVSLLESPEGSAYVAAALPSPVACPTTLNAAELSYPETAELTGPIGQSVLGFLTAYLTGQGGLDRYVSPGTSLASMVPPPYTAVQLSALRTHEKFEPGQAARPLDGTETHVLARASGFDATGQATVADYALTLAARAGRWEVRRIDPAPLLTAVLAAPTASTPPPAASTRSGRPTSVSPTAG